LIFWHQLNAPPLNSATNALKNDSAKNVKTARKQTNKQSAWGKCQAIPSDKPSSISRIRPSPSFPPCMPCLVAVRSVWLGLLDGLGSEGEVEGEGAVPRKTLLPGPPSSPFRPVAPTAFAVCRPLPYSIQSTSLGPKRARSVSLSLIPLPAKLTGRCELARSSSLLFSSLLFSSLLFSCFGA
jgi:hypothetical protein